MLSVNLNLRVASFQPRSKKYRSKKPLETHRDLISGIGFKSEHSTPPSSTEIIMPCALSHICPQAPHWSRMYLIRCDSSIAFRFNLPRSLRIVTFTFSVRQLKPLILANSLIQPALQMSPIGSVTDSKLTCYCCEVTG
eukprot:Blabericola_migrator_1__4857@NODE_2544_length_2625_cov_8_788116_g1591_i0_p1_GENE_NODE_2544_length_2625_cov_8_788116_g1591_i0NODE_2544_length_2625_cov_8_788116_g1591_i0_p1_ORF_typecomplete_len138_score10_90_NODE_2544_length_2625_cov_8_788116_g1591_i016932106